MTLNLDQVFQQVAKVAPLIDQAFSKKEGEPAPNTMKQDIEDIGKDLEHLHEISGRLMKESGINAENIEETIWKTPTSRREVEKQIEAMSQHMAQEMNEIQNLLVKTVGILSQKLTETMKKEETGSREETDKKPKGNDGQQQ